MKIRKQEKIRPFNVLTGDSVTLTYTDEDGAKHDVLSDIVDRSMKIDEAVIFEVEPGEFGAHVTDGIGGAFLQTET